MRKFMLIFMAMSVLIFSGCGGSIYNDSDSDDSSSGTYDTQSVLAGNWTIMEGSGEAVHIKLGAERILSLRMDHSSMRFSDVDISGDIGTAT